MIRSDRPTVSPIVNIVFVPNLFCFDIFWKVRMDVRTDSAKTVNTTGRDCGSAEWTSGSKETASLLFALLQFHGTYAKYDSCLVIGVLEIVCVLARKSAKDHMMLSFLLSLLHIRCCIFTQLLHAREIFAYILTVQSIFWKYKSDYNFNIIQEILINCLKCSN